METQDVSHCSSPTASKAMKHTKNVHSHVSETFSATKEPVPVDAFRSHVSHLSSVNGFLREFLVSWLVFDYLLSACMF